MVREARRVKGMNFSPMKKLIFFEKCIHTERVYTYGETGLTIMGTAEYRVIEGCEGYLIL